jgi:hypothetical protein
MLEKSEPCSPVLSPEFVVVYEGGELPRGLYFYVITSVRDAESIPNHILQVFASNKHNSVVLQWQPVPGVEEYRIYRGTEQGKYDGFFTAYGSTGYFCDDGLGELNLDVCQSIPR